MWVGTGHGRRGVDGAPQESPPSAMIVADRGAGQKRPVSLACGKEKLVGRQTTPHPQPPEAHKHLTCATPRTKHMSQGNKETLSLAQLSGSLLAAREVHSDGALTCPLHGPCVLSSHVTHGLQEGVCLSLSLIDLVEQLPVCSCALLPGST